MSLQEKHFNVSVSVLAQRDNSQAGEHFIDGRKENEINSSTHLSYI